MLSLGGPALKNKKNRLNLYTLNLSTLAIGQVSYKEITTMVSKKLDF
jgi:hypothetical protein